MTIATKPRCAARTGYRWTEYGFEPVRCHQWKGLVAVGELWACVAPGHREQVLALAKRAAG